MVVDGGIYTRDGEVLLSCCGTEQQDKYFEKLVPGRRVQGPLIKIIVVLWDTSVRLLSSKQCVSVHELTWDKRSEIGRRS